MKISLEQPRGLRAILKSVYHSSPLNEATFYDPSPKHAHCKLEYQRLIYGLAYFHGVALERRHYGAIGWNNFYDFNPTDLAISLHHFKEIMLKPQDK